MNDQDTIQFQELLNARSLAEERDEAIRDAWQIISVLHANAMDHEGEGWKRALDWMSKWETRHVVPQLIRAGHAIKSTTRDIDEAIDALNRWKEMIKEDGPEEDYNGHKRITNSKG